MVWCADIIELQGDGQLEQLELLESTDSISVKSFEVSCISNDSESECVL